MTVGVNARVPTALPEAGSAASGQQGDGEGFAQLLTGVATGAAASTDGKADAAAPGVAAAALHTVAKTADADGAAASKIVAADSAEAPKGELPAGLSDIVARLVHLDRIFGRGSGKASEGAETVDGKGESKTETEDGSVPTDISATSVATLLQASGVIAPAVTATAQAPAAPTGTVALPAALASTVAALTARADAAVGTASVTVEQDAAQTAPLDLGKFAKLAKPIEVGQLFGSALRNDPNAAAGQHPALAALIHEAAGAAHISVGKAAQQGAADIAAPGALLSGSPLPDASTLLQPQAALSQLQPGGPIGDAAAVPNMGELSIDRQLDLAKDAQWVDRLARDIARSAGQDGPLRFRLNPETLGSLHVEVSQSHAGASIRLTADTEAARSILADAQPRLLAEARAQGVRIAEAHVGLNSNGQQPDQRRQDDGRQDSFIRTASIPEPETEPSEQRASAAAERFA